jgi:hypothetical protein
MLWAGDLRDVALRVARGPRGPEHLCLDKGDDCAGSERDVRDRGPIRQFRRPREKALLGCVTGVVHRWATEQSARAELRPVRGSVWPPPAPFLAVRLPA